MAGHTSSGNHKASSSSKGHAKRPPLRLRADTSPPVWGQFLGAVPRCNQAAAMPAASAAANAPMP